MSNTAYQIRSYNDIEQTSGLPIVVFTGAYLQYTVEDGIDNLPNLCIATGGGQPVMNFFDVAKSSTYTYTIDCDWHGISPVDIYFFNRKGGFEPFTFNRQNTKHSDIKRDTMQKNLGATTATTWSYNSIDRGTTVFNTEIGDRWKLESDWISDAQSTWLQELVESHEVYYHDGASMIPVTVKNPSTEIKTIKNMEKLFNLSIEIEFSNKRWTQRG